MLAEAGGVDAFVYFGTCSVDDPEMYNLPYVTHKLEMEKFVATHPQNLIVRLPQVAGRTPNPHTLFNFLYFRIARSERFTLWAKAKRNIIDVADVAIIVRQLLTDSSMRNIVVNVASSSVYSMFEIVEAMEKVVGKPAIFDILDKGSEYRINIDTIKPFLKITGISFAGDYLERVIGYYYKDIYTEGRINLRD